MILIEYEGNGYSGYSMSRNAVSAYDNGEKPKSKWTREDILNIIEDINPDLLPLLNKVSVSCLKDIFLYKSSWHHTSSYYNKTDFYSVNEDKIEELTTDELAKLLDKYNQNKKTKINDDLPKARKGKIDYIIWTGTRNHPKANPGISRYSCTF
jgi:hypothetical protein